VRGILPLAKQPETEIKDDKEKWDGKKIPITVPKAHVTASLRGVIPCFKA
jgi:hypothetical protein